PGQDRDPPERKIEGTGRPGKGHQHPPRGEILGLRRPGIQCPGGPEDGGPPVPRDAPVPDPLTTHRADPGARCIPFSRPEKLTHGERSIPLTTRENHQVASWTRENGRGFHFGIEAEYLLVDAETFRPLWHHDLEFEALNAAMEAIPVGDLPPLDGLELELPHRKLMPFVVEGYHLPAPELTPRDLLPKGLEIRTPVCPSIEICLECLQELQRRMQLALGELGCRAVPCSHHPIEDRFEGP